MVIMIHVRSGSQTISIQPIILSLIPSQIAYGLILPFFLRRPNDKVEEQKPYLQQQLTIIENTKEEI